MKTLIKIFLLSFGVLGLMNSKAQSSIPTSKVIQIISADWSKDSASCLGFRIKFTQTVLNSKPDSVSKNELFRSLGQPNIIQKFYSGVSGKNYVEYIYYVYKDQCPKISVEGYAVGFVYDEGETTLIEIVDHDYCG